MTFGELLEFWLAQHLAGLIVGGAFLVLVVVVALVDALVVTPIRARRRGGR